VGAISSAMRRIWWFAPMQREPIHSGGSSKVLRPRSKTPSYMLCSGIYIGRDVVVDANGPRRLWATVARPQPNRTVRNTPRL